MWFRRDLRLSDHPALLAAQRAAGADGVAGVFIADDELLAPAGTSRVRFLASCLDALDRAMGGALILREGPPSDALLSLVHELGARQVFITTDHGPYGRARDEAVRASLRQVDCELVAVDSNYVAAPGSISTDDGRGFQVFGAFRRRFEALEPPVSLRAPQITWRRAPSELATDALVVRSGRRLSEPVGAVALNPPVELPAAGERAALERLAAFADEDATTYHVRRDLLGERGTSQLSWHLRFGALHPRRVLAEVNGPDEGSRTFRTEIAWREFYADVLYRHPSSARHALKPSMAALRVDTGAPAQERFVAWASGRTGLPLIDASMRQLAGAGWLHNRARMLAASFLVKHLHLDWRWGARWFMFQLLDGDLASNAHGWQWTAGTGTDAAPYHRIFNPVVQAKRFDPDATYIHRWVPELRETPPPQVFEPGGGHGLLRPPAYPEPIVELQLERDEALARFAELRGAEPS
jgi:deoxyribodipyrimidine photo-lyase